MRQLKFNCQMIQIVCDVFMCNVDKLQECYKLFQGQELSDVMKKAYCYIINNENVDKAIEELLSGYYTFYGEDEEEEEEEEDDHTCYMRRKESYFITKVWLLRM